MRSLRVLAAERFCQIAHDKQKRKYSNVPYWTHPFEVAAMVRKITDDEDTEIVALLHDVIEDTKYTRDDISTLFGTRVAYAVEQLSNTPAMPGVSRAERKQVDRTTLGMFGGAIEHNVKVADVICNTRDIVQYDPAFAEVYMDEIRQLLPCLTFADPDLLRAAQKQLDKYYGRKLDG